MRSVWGTCAAVIVGGCAVLASGCPASQEPYLRWQAGPPSGRMDGKVALKLVPNLRPAGRGDGGVLDIGRERSPAGATTALRLEGEASDSLDRVVIRLTIDAMRSAGLAPTQTEDASATAHLTVEIHEFWCDAARSAKATVGLELVLLDPASGGERLRVPVTASGAGDSCRAAFRIALSQTYRELTNAFAEAEVHAAALGGSANP
jgi:hypothetical protein